MAKSKILHCNCKHKSQDQIHGDGRRVHNPTKNTVGERTEMRCTVCGTKKFA